MVGHLENELPINIGNNIFSKNFEGMQPKLIVDDKVCQLDSTVRILEKKLLLIILKTQTTN